VDRRCEGAHLLGEPVERIVSPPDSPMGAIQLRGCSPRVVARGGCILGSKAITATSSRVVTPELAQVGRVGRSAQAGLPWRSAGVGLPAPWCKPPHAAHRFTLRWPAVWAGPGGGIEIEAVPVQVTHPLQAAAGVWSTAMRWPRAVDKTLQPSIAPGAGIEQHLGRN